LPLIYRLKIFRVKEQQKYITKPLPLATTSLIRVIQSLPLVPPSLIRVTQSLPLATPSLIRFTQSLTLATPSLIRFTQSLTLATSSLIRVIRVLKPYTDGKAYLLVFKLNLLTKAFQKLYLNNLLFATDSTD